MINGRRNKLCERQNNLYIILTTSEIGYNNKYTALKLSFNSQGGITCGVSTLIL
jgi:hypothetical protein